MYEVIFTDSEQGVNVESFNTFDEAAEYWNDYADAWVEHCLTAPTVK